MVVLSERHLRELEVKLPAPHLPTDHISTGRLLLSYLHAANAEDSLAACLSPAIENLVRAMKGHNNPFEKLLTVVVLALDPGGDRYVVEPG